MTLAIAVIRYEIPEVVVADSTHTLDRVLALRYVAQTRPDDVEGDDAIDAIRRALTEEQWGTAVAEWSQTAGGSVDVYDDVQVWTVESIDEEMLRFELDVAPIFGSSSEH